MYANLEILKNSSTKGVSEILSYTSTYVNKRNEFDLFLHKYYPSKMINFSTL